MRSEYETAKLVELMKSRAEKKRWRCVGGGGGVVHSRANMHNVWKETLQDEPGDNGRLNTSSTYTR